MLQIAVIGALLVIVPQTLATVHLPGRCPNYIALPNFNNTEFLGEWYEIQRLAVQDEPGHADCVVANYSVNMDGSTLDVINRMLVLENPPRRVEQRGYARYLDTTGRLVMIYNETDPSANIFDYYITNTDYTQYMIATSCENLNNTHYAESAWIFSRSRILSASASTAVNQIIQSWASFSHFRRTNQDQLLCSSSEQLALGTITLLMVLLTSHFLR
ncbi:hypothetical protein DMENIID0001_159100 [Sergentomyia squamirostris]